MINLFIPKLILSFLAGSIWITTSTIVAEKFGTKVGGVLAGLPTTVLISFFFIGWTQNVYVVREATAIVPIIMGMNAVFVLIYILLLPKSFLLAVSGAMFSWLMFVFGLYLVEFDNFLLGFPILIFLVSICYYIPEKRMVIVPQKKRNIKYSFLQLIMRGLISGGIIASAVTIAKFGGPLLGGAFSCFPAVMTSTMIITYLAHGKSFSMAVMKILMISAPANVVAFAATLRFAIIPFGLIGGTLVSFAISILGSYFVFLFVRKKML